MKVVVDEYARFGGPPLLASASGPGQQNNVEWEVVEAALRGIFERRYFCNNGPLVQKLDVQTARVAGVRHAVCVTNDMIAGMVLGSALQTRGEVVMPVTAAPTLIEALRLNGLVPVFCDIDPDTFVPTYATLQAAITERTSVIVGSHLFGRDGASEQVVRHAQALALTIIVDAGRTLCSSIAGSRFGRATIFTFDSRGVINGAEGAAIVTDDDTLAARLRTIRNFHAAETYAEVPLRLNGKMSEAQAALVLAALPAVAGFANANLKRSERYAEVLSGIDGIRLIGMDVRSSTCAQLVIVVEEAAFGLSRDQLRELLVAENISADVPVSVARSGFPGADKLAETLLELPNGQQTSIRDVNTIADFIRQLVRDASMLRKAFDR